MKMRTIALILAGVVAAGCSGSVNNLLPSNSAGYSPAGSAHGLEPARRRHVKTFVRIRIPHRSRKHARTGHPATISSLTQSLSIAVNGGTATLFNTTPASPGCTVGSSGTTCTFAVNAPIGTDTFTVITYSAASGGGTALDSGVVTVPIGAGKANQVAISLGPVVTTTADSGMGSLRYAIGSASRGDTIMFLLPSGSTISLASSITISSNVTIAGPGASSLTISGGSTHQIFLISGTATISGITLTQGKAATTHPGGAIFNIGSLTLANDVIGNSTSTVALRRTPHAQRAFAIAAHRMHPHCTATTNDGGALYNNGTANISGTTFSGNVIQTSFGCITAEGGAIFNDTNGSLTSTGDTYTNNSAAAGGAVYNAAYGLASFTNDTFSGNSGCTAASGCPTSGCGASSCTSFAIGLGAAIYDHGLGITVVNSTFSNNVAGGPTAGSQGQGGAIFLDASSQLPTITGSAFTGNVAGGGTSSCSTGMGGAILATNSIELDNDTFTNNSSSGDQSGLGGAVVGQHDVTGTSDTFSGNAASATGGPCTANGVGGGGGVYSGGNLTIGNSTFKNNSATANAAGAGGAVVAGMNATISNSTFTSNSATSTGTNGATSNSAAGGAVIGAAILKLTGSTFTSNTVSLAGSSATEAIAGAVLGQTAIITTNNTFTSNSVTSTANATAAGGALATLSGTWVSHGDTFTSNSITSAGTAGAGAAINGSGGNCIISNTTATSNTATGGQAVAGGIAVGSTCAITNVTVTGNTATATAPGGIGAGGGLVDTGGSTILNSTITGNTASDAGGGIITETTPTVIANTSVSGNAVLNASGTNPGGGGIFDTGGLQLDAVTIANNTVTVSGSAPVGGGGIYDTGGVLMVYSTVSGNKVLGSATNGGGGGVYTNNGIFGVNDTIGNNASSLAGGGFFLDGSAAGSFSNSTIYKNGATGNGGNVNIGASGALTLVNSILAGGSAAAGPDAYNAGTFTSNDYNIIQTAPAGNAITGTTTHNLSADPKLLALTNNGGPTFTFASQATSPGTAYITYAASSCGAVSVLDDQRGYTRGAGGKCDVGAYEYAGVATAIRHRHRLMKAHFRRAGRTVIRLPRLKPVRLELPSER